MLGIMFFGSNSRWQIKTFTLISLFTQSMLVVMGNRRKFLIDNKLRFVLWLSYQWATDLVNLLVYSIFSNVTNSDPKLVLEAYWAAFFLLHYGGSDTMTAYSLEDNELWLRNSLKIGFRIGQVIYIIFRTWTKTSLDFMAVLIFIAGTIKTLERIWVLRSATRENFKESMLPGPDSGPNYSRYMEEYQSKQYEGFDVESGRFKKVPIVGNLSLTAPENVRIADEATLQDAYIFFKTSKQLFADLVLNIDDKVKSQSFFQSTSCEQAFKVIEVELGFMFDVFYTKAFIFYSVKGGLLRLLSFFCIVSAFLVFLKIEKHPYSAADVIITYILLGGAIMLELYDVLVLLKSDWTMVWLSKHKNAVVDLLYRAISSIPLGGKKRWSNAMAQYNLIKHCFIQHKRRCLTRCLKHKRIQYQDSADVSIDLKKLIFEQLQKKSRSATDFKACKELCAFRSERVLENAKYFEDEGEISEEDRKTLKKSVEVEFDKSILLWHIATSLRYSSDRDKISSTVNSPNLHYKASKLLSDYMLYLIVTCPSMLPNGIAQVRYQDTVAEAGNFFEERKYMFDVNEACTKLLEVNTEISPSEVKGDKSKSVLFDGCILAKSLQCLKPKKRWELISHVWVEMLCYAANKCRWNDHVRRLCRGGELLTHVSLLMAHLAITEQFKIFKGHAKPKLIVR